MEEILIGAASVKEVQIPRTVTECYRNDLDFDRLISNFEAFTIYVAIIAKSRMLTASPKLSLNRTREQSERCSVKSESFFSCV